MLSASTSARSVPKFLHTIEAIAWNRSPEWCFVLLSLTSALIVSVFSLSETLPMYFFSGFRRFSKYSRSSSKNVTSPAWNWKIILLVVKN